MTKSRSSGAHVRGTAPLDSTSSSMSTVTSRASPNDDAPARSRSVIEHVDLEHHRSTDEVFDDGSAVEQHDGTVGSDVVERDHVWISPGTIKRPT